MKRILQIILCLQFVTFGLAAQSPKVVQKYEYGKELLKEEKYFQAIEVFKRTAKSENGEKIYLNSIYLHALALYKVDKKQEARQLLFLLADKHSNWGGLDEVYYLMALIDFDWKSTVDAIDNLAKIKGEAIKKDAYNLKKAKISDDTIDRLKYLYAKYPNDEAIGKVLLGKLYELGGGNDLALLEELQTKYNSSSKIDTKEPVISIKRDNYNVAVLLPFNAERITAVTQANFVIDLYEGIQLGLEELEKRGVKINLYTYDTKRDSATTAKILANPDLVKMDLLIGPLYSNTLQLVQEFSKEYQIPFVNPISDNSLIIKENPNAFLLSAGFETVAESVADYTQTNLKGKEAIIISGNSARDTLAAKAFHTEMILKGGKVYKTVEFSYDERAYYDLIEDLSDLKQDTGKYFVYIISNDFVVGRTSLSALRNLLFEGVIFAPSKWLESPQIAYSRLEASNVHLVGPLFYDDSRTEVGDFTNAYVQKVKLLPSKFSFMGYETVVFFGQQLFTYGLAFTDEIHKPTNNISGTLFRGLNYLQANDNQRVDIIKFEKGELQIVNQKDGIE